MKGMLAAMAREGHSDSERQKAGAVLRKALNFAVDHGRLAVNPMARVRLPTPKRPEPVALDREQIRALLAAADDAGAGHLLRAWVDACLRPAEAMAQQVGDIDLERGTLSVKRSLDNVTNQIKTPKTRKSKRTVPLSKSTVARVRAAVDGKPAAAPLYPDSRGGHWWLGNFAAKVFRPLVKAAGLSGVKGLSPKALRHTGATLLLRSNRVPIKVVSERLGHEDVMTTLRVYSHVLEGDQERAAEVMEELLGD